MKILSVSSCHAKSTIGIGGPQDVGGRSDIAAMRRGPMGQISHESRHDFAYWESQVEAMIKALIRKGLYTLEEMRRNFEVMDPKAFEETGYYEKRAFSITNHCLAKGVITEEQLYQKLDKINVQTETPIYSSGDLVIVRDQFSQTLWRQPHTRTPGYIFGKPGEILEYRGNWGNPELLSWGLKGPEEHLYRVRFKQKDVWEDYSGAESDTLDVDVFQHWLKTPGSDLDTQHKTRAEVERAANAKEPPLNAYAILARAVCEILIESNVLDAESIRHWIEVVDRSTSQSQATGGRITAEAWCNPEFKKLLLTDGQKAVTSLGFDHGDSELIFLENTDEVQNVVVCTLCSCYPRMLLGVPPDWFKSNEYRSAVVRDPRAVLKEFGTVLPDNTKVRVFDSTSDLRYVVVPNRPRGTENWSKEQLAEIVSRDCLIGVANPVVDVEKVKSKL